MTQTIYINSLGVSPTLNTLNVVADALIVSPSYNMKPPSYAFARENLYSKEEQIFELETSVDGDILRIEKFVGYVKGNIGIHFIELKAPLLLNVSTLADGELKVVMFVDYLEHKVGEVGALTKLEVGVYLASEEVKGTTLMTFNKNSSAIVNGVISISKSIVSTKSLATPESTYRKSQEENKRAFTGSGYIEGSIVATSNAVYIKSNLGSLVETSVTANRLTNNTLCLNARKTYTSSANDKIQKVNVDGHIIYVDSFAPQNTFANEPDQEWERNEVILLDDGVTPIVSTNTLSVTGTIKAGTFFVNGKLKYVSITDVVSGDLLTDDTKFKEVDSISRQDFVFLEVWEEKITEKDFIYPLGNTQFRINGEHTTDLGLPEAIDGAFNGSDTYSLYGNWQPSGDLVGKGYEVSTMSDSDFRLFISNPKNNVFLSPEGDYIQVRYRHRVVNGYGNNWVNLENGVILGHPKTMATGYYITVKGLSSNIPFDIGDLGGGSANYIFTTQSTTKRFVKGLYTNDGRGSLVSSYNQLIFALPTIKVQRRNTGAYHPLWNAEGTALFSDGKEWWETSQTVANTSECFTKALATSGHLHEVSGRPDGLLSDVIDNRDIEDLRMNVNKQSKEETLEEFTRLAINGGMRGKENGDVWNYVDVTIKYIHPGGYMDYFIDGVLTLEDRTRIEAVVSLDTENYIPITVYTRVSKYRNNTYDTSYGDSYFNSSIYTAYFNVGEKVRLFFKKKKSTYTQNNTALVCDIIGDPKNYPQEWKDNGVPGIPNLVNDKGESNLPANWQTNSNVPNGISYINLSRLHLGEGDKVSAYENIKKVIAILPDGSYKELIFNPNWDAVADELPVYWVMQNETPNLGERYWNTIAYGVGSNDIDINANAIVMVFYDSYAKIAKPANKEFPLLIGDEVHAFKRGDNINYGLKLFSSLLNKVPKGTNDGYRQWKFIEKGFHQELGIFSDGHNKWKHQNIDLNNDDSVDLAVKCFTTLTEKDKRLKVQIPFMEMKWASNPSEYVGTPHIYLNNGKILASRRSYNLVVFSPLGVILDKVTFDVYGESVEADKLEDYLNGITSGNIVALSTYDEPKNNVVGNQSLMNAMYKIGCSSVIDNLEYRSSYAVIGIKGSTTGTTLLEGYTPPKGLPIRLTHNVNDSFKITVESRGILSESYLAKQAGWGDSSEFLIGSNVNITIDDNGNPIQYGIMEVPTNRFLEDK